MKLKLLSLIFLALLIGTSSLGATIYQLDKMQRSQIIDGFGGSIAFWGTHADDKALEAAILGLKVTYLRVQGEVSPRGDAEHNREILERALALNPSLKILLTFWQPRSLKHLDKEYWLDVTGEGHKAQYQLKESRKAEWADEIVARVKLYQSWGIPIDTLAIQNEANWSHLGTQTCVWEPLKLKNFIEEELQPKLDSNIKIAAGDLAYIGYQASEVKRFKPVFESSSVDVVAYHMYDSYPKGEAKAMSAVYQNKNALSQIKQESFSNKKLWMTETTGAQWNSSEWHTYGWVDGMDEHQKAIRAAQYIHASLVDANANAFFWWGLVYSLAPDRQKDPRVRQKHRDEGLVLVSEKQEEGRQRFLENTKTYYTFQQYSRFIKPGYQRLELNSPKDIETSMYSSKNDREVVVVAINDHDDPRSVYLDIQGKSLAKVFVTDETRNCQQVYLRGKLPPKSVTTFIYR